MMQQLKDQKDELTASNSEPLIRKPLRTSYKNYLLPTMTHRVTISRNCSTEIGFLK
jgi:hypothetical protein